MTTAVISRPKQVEGSGYASLRDRVKETLLEGQQKIEQQKVLTYWQAGKFIKEHLYLHKERSEYEKKRWKS